MNVALCCHTYFIFELVEFVSDVSMDLWSVLFFFFQAEDGIRDLTVTGVQTCALPIFHRCSITESALPTLQGWPRYSASMMPPTERPNCTLAKYMRTRAKRKLGVARPT